VGSIDLFAEEDIEFARRLVNAGVPTELLVVPGAFHGFQFIAPRAAVSQQFTAALDAALARALSPEKN
jgi:acetyl esterase/lipase